MSNTEQMVSDNQREWLNTMADAIQHADGKPMPIDPVVADLLRALLAQPADQHQGDPVALPARKPSGDIPDFTPGSGNKAERRATELVAQLQADLTERDQRLDQFQQVMQKVATLRGTLDLHGIREEVEALLWPDLHSRPEERGTPETEPCSGCGTPGWTGACAKCVPY